MDERKNIQPEEFQDQDFRDTFGDGAEFQKAFDSEPEQPAEEPVEEAIEEPTPEEVIAVWRDKYMRLQAEFDNYRKRTAKEKEAQA